MLFFRNFTENSIVLRSSKVEQKFFDIFSTIEDVMKSVNRSIGGQMMVMTLELFLFGLILVFCAATSSKPSDFIQFLVTSCYVHIILFQVSYITNSTMSQVIFMAINK